MYKYFLTCHYYFFSSEQELIPAVPVPQKVSKIIVIDACIKSACLQKIGMYIFKLDPWMMVQCHDKLLFSYRFLYICTCTCLLEDLLSLSKRKLLVDAVYSYSFMYNFFVFSPSLLCKPQ